MGLTLEFCIGNLQKIEKAIRECKLDILDDPEVVQRRADLSLHIVPKDLDLLSRELGKHSDSEPLDLRPFLNVVVDEEDRGLLLVDDAWVKYAASIKEDAENSIVEDWFVDMRREYPGENIQITPEARVAVRGLLGLCREAAMNKATVLHSWFA
jgi:hypothetical protein